VVIALSDSEPLSMILSQCSDPLYRTYILLNPTDFYLHSLAVLELGQFPKTSYLLDIIYLFPNSILL